MKKVPKNCPSHIAFIMDGNRRWAVRHGMNKLFGHEVGAKVLVKVIKTIAKLKEIKCVSFFAFSTENWNREKTEIESIFALAKKIVKENEDYFMHENIKIVCSGDVNGLPKDVKEIVIKACKDTENNTGLIVNMAINYGGRADIVHAVNKLIEKGQTNVTENDIFQNLYLPLDIDLVVRTSGEKRLSNFMLYQLAYSELYFTKTCWPAFNERQLFKALFAYSKRNRRFGGN